jgi:hypothetical protein
VRLVLAAIATPPVIAVAPVDAIDWSATTT